ncbi:26819_t:CDS:10, partial [Gigaspora margarita]
RTRILCVSVKKSALLSLKTMFETIDDNEEIIKASIKLIWMATNGKVVNIIFDDLMLSAKVVFDNDTSKIIILEEPEAVLLNINNYIRIRNELVGKGSIVIDEEIGDSIQANANRIESDIAKPAQQTEEQQINKCFKLSKKNQFIFAKNILKYPLDYEHVDKNQQENNDHEETDGSVFSDQLNQSSIKNIKRKDEVQDLETNIQESIQNADPLSHETSNSINIYQSQINKNTKKFKRINEISDEHDNNVTKRVSSNSSKVPKEYDIQASDEYSDSAEEFAEKEFDNAITSRLKKNKKANKKVDDKLLESVPSNLTDNSSSSLPSISEVMNKVNIRTSLLKLPIPNDVPASVLKSQQINMPSVSSITDAQSVNTENEEILPTSINVKAQQKNNEIESASSYLVPIVLVNNNSYKIPHNVIESSTEAVTVGNKDLKRKQLQHSFSESNYVSESSTETVSVKGKDLKKKRVQHTPESDSNRNSTEEVTVSKTENDMAKILKEKFENIMNYQFKIYENQLFSTNSSIEKFFTTNFDDLFDIDNNIIHFSIQTITTYSSKKELLELYLQGHKTLRKHVHDKMKSMLNVETRHELRYWIGTWRLIELLHITRCSANILVESGLTSRYLTRTENAKYDRFLKNLLNDNNAYYKTPEFNKVLLQKVKMLDL